MTVETSEASSEGARLSLLRRCERTVTGLSRHRVWSCVLIGLLALVSRLILLPLIPIPKPLVHDEFSYILGAETFAQGRLTNPPHPLWEFFETYHVNMQPTYASKYPPGQALVLALGIKLFGHPWFGVLLSLGLMCGLLCWAIQGWFPPKYGLYGGVLAVLIFGLGHYWVNSYWGGALAACGASLVLGAMPRLAGNPRVGPALAAASGGIVLANTRPFEGLVFVSAAALSLLLMVRRAGTSGRLLRWQIVLPVLLLTSAGIGAMGYYNRAVTGSATTLPYSIAAKRYSASPTFWILPPLPAAHREYRDPQMRQFWEEWDVEFYSSARSNPLRVIKNSIEFPLNKMTDGASGPMYFALLLSLALPLYRKTVPLLVILAICGFAYCLERLLLLHYVAPIMPVVMLLAMQGMRVMRLLQIGKHPLGLRLTAMVLSASVLMAMVNTWESHNSIRAGELGNALEERSKAERKLRVESGQHVVIVRYDEFHNPHMELVYNGPDIDAQKIVWAIDRGPAENQRLIEYYPGRHFWLLRPDPPHASLTPYEK